MDYQALKTELTNGHPITGAYSVDDATAVSELNEANVTANRSSMTGSELLSATDATEYLALTDAKKDLWLSLCAIDSVDPFGPAVDMVKDIWGQSSVTVSTLATMRVKTISRAQELGFGEIVIGDVQNARAL